MIHISRSLVGAAELEAMDRVVRQDGYLGMGREVRAFEAELQDYLGGQEPHRHLPQFRHRRPASGGCRPHQPRG